MTDHLTPEQLEQYRRGAATPGELLALDDHLSQCEACRTALEKLVKPLSLVSWAEGLTRYENKAPYDNNVEDAPLAPAAAVRPAKTPRRWPRLLWIPALAAALVVAVVLRNRPVPPEPKKTFVTVSAIVAALRDAGGTVALDSLGVLHTPAAIDPADQALLAEALRTRSLPLAATPSDLAAPPGTLLGPSKPDEFAPIAPLSRTVYADRPEFRWQALKGAVSYEVQVFDSAFHEVDSSGKIRETHWTPVQPLARGALYQWQIIAYRKADSVRAPTPPASDARFRILNAQTFSKVEAARAGPDPAHFLAAILLAKAGMKDEALNEMDAVSASNPGSDVVRDLIAGLDH